MSTPYDTFFEAIKPLLEETYACFKQDESLSELSLKIKSAMHLFMRYRSASNSWECRTNLSNPAEDVEDVCLLLREAIALIPDRDCESLERLREILGKAERLPLTFHNVNKTITVEEARSGHRVEFDMSAIDKVVAENRKLTPRKFREWVYIQVRNSRKPVLAEFYVGNISMRLLDEARPRVRVEGLLGDVFDQREYLTRLFLDSRLKSKLDNELKMARMKIATGDELNKELTGDDLEAYMKRKIKTANNKKNKEGEEELSMARDELNDYCDKMRNELEEYDKKTSENKTKRTSEEKMKNDLNNFLPFYEGKVNTYGNIRDSQKLQILEGIKRRAEEAKRKAEEEAKQNMRSGASAKQNIKAQEEVTSGELSLYDQGRLSGISEFIDDLRILIDETTETEKEEKNTRDNYIEKANVGVNSLNYCLQIVGEKTTLLLHLETNLASLCRNNNRLEVYKRWLLDLD